MNRKRSKWSYAIGCTGRDMCYTLVSMFLAIYIQYSGLMDEKQFGVFVIIMVLCKVWDAVNDPMMGTIISNTKTRLGKYRPWVLIGCLSNAIFLILLFTLRFEGEGQGWLNVAVLGVVYLLWGMTFTMNDVSYWSLLPALSEGKKDRDNLTSMVAVFASIGAFTAGGLVPMLTTGEVVLGYRVFGITFAVIFMICQFLVFFFTHDNKYDKFMLSKEELSQEPKEKTINLKDMFKILVRNKQLLVMAVVVLLYTTASGFLTVFGQNFFYFKFGYDGGLVTLFTVVYAVGTLVPQFLFPVITTKFTRKQIVSASLLITIVGYIAFFIVANLNIDSMLCFTLLCIFGVLVFGGQGMFYMAMLIMLTNTIEYDEWKNGERNEAVTFSVRPFMVKLSGAIQTGIVSLTLIACGLYSLTQDIGKLEIQKGQELITDTQLIQDANKILNQATSNQEFFLSIAMTIIPVIMFIATYFIIKKKYIIDEDMYEKMTKEIAERKQNK